MRSIITTLTALSGGWPLPRPTCWLRGEHESTFIGFVALFKDITEIFRLRRMEEYLTKEKARIAHEKISSLHKLAMGVAHEIRNPTVTIGGFAARIPRNPTNSEETRRFAKNIVEDARKLEAVVDEVQQVLRSSRGQPLSRTTLYRGDSRGCGNGSDWTSKRHLSHRA